MPASPGYDAVDNPNNDYPLIISRLISVWKRTISCRDRIKKIKIWSASWLRILSRNTSHYHFIVKQILHGVAQIMAFLLVKLE